MDVATLRMVAPPGRRDEIVGALRWLAGPVRAHRGCAGCRILQDLDDENALVLLEEWTSRRAFERHLRSDDCRRLLAVAELAAERPEIHFDRVAERRGLGLVAEVRDGADRRPDRPIRGIEPEGKNLRNAPSDGLAIQPGAEAPTTEAKGEPDMRTRLLSTTIVLALLLALASLPAFAAKVDVCHMPPGNPDNWHTISVSTNALAAHLGHDDLEGSCAANCETLCDDFDACTQDIESDYEQCLCNAEPRPAVDCDDSNPCTVDGCNSEFGCTYDAAAANGDSCDDDDPDTSDDVCTDGVCAGTPSFDPCNPNLCQNGGICIDLGDGGFICNCADGWFGDLCQTSNCCFAWGGLGCNDATCENRVCAQLPECCSVGWGSDCAFSVDGGLNCDVCQ